VVYKNKKYIHNAFLELRRQSVAANTHGKMNRYKL